ncbi:hypothetical protein D1872_223070 [compost metagenome]
MEIKVHLLALVLIGLQRGEICGLTFFATVGVGGAGNRAIDAHADLLAFQLGNRRHVDTGQELGRLLHDVHQRLRHRRLYAEFFADVADVRDAVQLGNLLQIGVKFKAGRFFH